MEYENKEPEILSRMSAATTKRTTVRLDKITFDTDRYCHRDPEALGYESLQSLMDSLTLEGLQVPIEVFIDENGNIVLLKGHRRVYAHLGLADKNAPGFTRDMEIEAIEVADATPVDLLVRSVSDNEVRLSLTRVDRIRVTKKLHDAGVQVERAARAMNISTKTYGRDLVIGADQWMFNHVIANNIGPTHAYALLVEAQKAGRVSEMREDFDQWVVGKQRMIDEKEKLRKARDGKELSPADKQVKKYLPNHLVTHWVELLREKRRFNDDAKWTFAAGIEKETGQLRISSVSLDLEKAPVDRLAKVASKLSALTKQLAPYVKTAYEKASGESASSIEDSPYDLEYLRALGLEEIAKDLEEQTKIASQPDGEESPQGQPEERQEEDLTEKVELPEAATVAASPSSSPPPPAPPAAASQPPSPQKPTGGKAVAKK
jgi:ParB-like chromosome segregation protein Spo0J